MSVVVIGGTSGMAQALARRFARAGHSLHLYARNQVALSAFAESCRRDFDVTVTTSKLELLDIDACRAAAETMSRHVEHDCFVLVAAGTIGGVSESPLNVAAALKLIDTNFRNIVTVLTPVAEAMAKHGSGCLIILSSVAGDRGRQSNYVYGAAKAGLTAYAQGLRNRLAGRGVHVITVKPGYVDTPMLRTALGDAVARTPRLLIGDPERVAEQIYVAALARKDVIYVPRLWRWI